MAETIEVEEDHTAPSFEPLMRLNKDLKTACRKLGRSKIRSLVQLYYSVQETRKRGFNQRFASDNNDEPNELVDWVAKNWRVFEDDVKKSMGEVADTYRVGQWLTSLTGIGPVLASAMLAEFKMDNAKTAGHFHRFCGLDPSLKWFSRKDSDALVKEVCGDAKTVEDGQLMEIASRMNVWVTVIQKRMAFLQKKEEGVPLSKTQASVAAACSLVPWSQFMKTLMWKCSESFVKFSNHPKQFYGTIYLNRKAYEQEKNERGDYKDLVSYTLTGKCPRCSGQRTCNVCHGFCVVAPKAFGADTEAMKAYREGKLPPGRIHLRCQRYAVKIFLSHLHHVMHLDVYGIPPPEPIAFKLANEAHARGEWIGDHRHFIEIPNFDTIDPWDAYKGRSLKEMAP